MQDLGFKEPDEPAAFQIIGKDGGGSEPHALACGQWRVVEVE